MRIDIHQHLWPAEFVSSLRRRSRSPMLRGWTLHLDGEPDFEVDPRTHDVANRIDQVRTDRIDLAVVSLSSPLGIEHLPPAEAWPLLDAYHDGVAALPRPFAGWAAACLTEVDPRRLAHRLDAGSVGLQLPATALADEEGYEHCAPLLAELEARGLPLFLHPGTALSPPGVPGWWPAVVPYVHQMHTAWFALRAFGRDRHPRLRVCFTALAGLAPLHGERLAARGGSAATIDRDTYLETSSYGRRAVDAAIRAVGIDGIVNGTDRPYAGPTDLHLGAAADHAINVTNPGRLLASRGGLPQRPSAQGCGTPGRSTSDAGRADRIGGELRVTV